MPLAKQLAMSRYRKCAARFAEKAQPNMADDRVPASCNQRSCSFVFGQLNLTHSLFGFDRSSHFAIDGFPALQAVIRRLHMGDRRPNAVKAKAAISSRSPSQRRLGDQGGHQGTLEKP
ncbi:hypothetical protein CSUB01_04034 [Colletotrichum sublineola]|uniref:Uncharacterized protein n=1 Tax=Colletotrichum sublineola TaxID=1173701 RepID=A0A066XE68_COLSU|nr:hypothetical protein CSUB01_04034 [Colletotrichum sublineola]